MTNKLEFTYSDYFKKTACIYNGKNVATFETCYQLSSICYSMYHLGYFKNTDFTVTKEALKHMGY